MKWFFFIWLCASTLMVQAQSGPKSFWIQFTDKDNTPFSLSQPEEFLSQRSIDRRTRQQITLKANDLPVDPAYVQAVLEEGASYLTHSKWLNSVTVAIPDSTVLNDVLALPFVQDHRPVKSKAVTYSPKEKWQGTLQKAVQASDYSPTDYGLAYTQLRMLKGDHLHEAGYHGEDIRIAVLDAGFPNVDNLEIYAAMRNEGRLVGGWDVVARDATFFEDHSHGTSVLSTMGAEQIGTLVGTAPKAEYLLLRTEDAATEFPIELDYWVAGAEFADSAGADIINSSLGYTTFQDPVYDFSYADMNGNTSRATIGADIAAAKGILVVSSAGNSGDDPWQYISSPADGDSVLAVGAVNNARLIATFSSRGPSADGRIKPNVCAMGSGAAVSSSSGSVADNGYGTSFAGPIMAGMAACLWQTKPDATNMEVFRAIEKSADRYHEPDDYYGYGIPDFRRAQLILNGLNPSDPEEDELLDVYPNPFNADVSGTFYASNGQDVVIRLVNNLGQEVARAEGTVNAFSGLSFRFAGLERLHDGVYTLSATSKDGKTSKKLLRIGQ